MTMSPHRRRIVEWALRVVALGAVGAAIVAWRPGIVGGFLHSWRAITLVLLGFGFAVGLEWWLHSRGRATWGRAAFYTLVVVGLAAAVVPSFVDRSVHENESDVFRDAQSAPTATTSRSAAPTGPVELGRAMLDGIDHRAAGTVRVARDADGRVAVRFEGLDVEPGPDYQVWVVPGPDREKTDGGANLGRLKANKGDQEYVAPRQFRVDGPLTVLIWCRAFAVPIGNATIG